VVKKNPAFLQSSINYDQAEKELFNKNHKSKSPETNYLNKNRAIKRMDDNEKKPQAKVS
jgi:hypothetical protein